MKERAIILLVCFGGMFLRVEASSEKQAECIKLNNEGVTAINNKDWKLAFDKFDAALKVDPGYILARDNIVVMHGQHGVQLRKEHKLQEALVEFHQAAYASAFWMRELTETIQQMGKKPDSFNDRIKLADQAKSSGDVIGAAVEYNAALKLSDDQETHRKLAKIYRLLNENAKADAEVEAAEALRKESR